MLGCTVRIVLTMLSPFIKSENCFCVRSMTSCLSRGHWNMILTISGNFSFLIMGKTKATNFLRLITFDLGIIFTVAYSPLPYSLCFITIYNRFYMEE